MEVSPFVVGVVEVGVASSHLIRVLSFETVYTYGAWTAIDVVDCVSARKKVWEAVEKANSEAI